MPGHEEGEECDDAPVGFSAHGVSSGLARALPLGLGGAAYGVVFGVLAGNAHLGLVEAVAMSAFVYSGAAQVAALGLWSSHLPFFTIWLATFLVSVRYLVLGASLRPWLGRARPGRAYGSLFLLTDESWALTQAELRAGRRDAGFLLGAGLANFATWTGGTAVGRILGGQVPDPSAWSLDVAPAAIFVALLAGLWRGRVDLLPWLAAAAIAAVAHQAIPGPWYVLLGAAAGMVAAHARGKLNRER